MNLERLDTLSLSADFLHICGDTCLIYLLKSKNFLLKLFT